MATPSAAMLQAENQETFNIIFSSQRTYEEQATEKRWPGWPGDTVFRLIVPAQKVGAIIGRKGEFVKKMCEETKSRIKIMDGVPGTAERVVMVSARDEPEAAISPAMDGLLHVHQRIISSAEVEGYPNVIHTPDGTVTSRLLVAATQAGSLIGKQGATIKSIQDTSAAVVRILPPDDLPLYALQDDRVVEIHGEPPKVHKAIELVASHLRKFLIDRSVLPLFELNRAVQSQSQQQQQQQQQGSQSTWASTATALPNLNTGVASGISNYGLSNLQQHDIYYQTPELTDTHTQHVGIALYGRDPAISSVTIPPVPIITQVTQSMQIPVSYADAIIGTGGVTISYIRRTSGASISIQETTTYPGQMTVELQGTANQVQSAQQLIESYMFGGSAPSNSGYSITPIGGSYNTVPSGLYSSANISYQPYVSQASYPASSVAGPVTGTYVSYGSAFSY